MLRRIYDESELVFAKHPKDPRFIDLTNQVFSRLKVLGFAGQNKNRQSHWYCRCECGNITKSDGSKLRSLRTFSCGCLAIERGREINTKHGHTKRGKISPEFRAWDGILRRVKNPNCKDYRDYGGRGITVCERWLKFENFFADMGERPSREYSIDRIDVNGNYCPENCRWADIVQQNSNKRSNINITHDGKTQTVSQWAVELRLNRHTIFARLKRGLSPEMALKTKTTAKGQSKPVLWYGKKPLPISRVTEQGVQND